MANLFSNTTSREIHLKSRPSGMPKEENFELVTVTLANPKEGEILIQNLWMSVDPYMRGRMNDEPSYISPFKIGHALEGSSIGKVVISNSPQFKAGDYVISMFGWRESFVAKASAVQLFDSIIPSQFAPIEAHLSVLGSAGLTAYAGLFRIAKLKPGEKVFISGATGAVGAVACALAKSIGCYVVGTAGSEEKRVWLEKELGVDFAIDYKAPNLDDAVAKAFPEGIDVYFENAGGEQLRIALDNMITFGRIAFCGMIENYNDKIPRQGPSNLYKIVTHKLSAEGFIVTDHYDLNKSFQRAAAELVRTGKLKWKHTVSEGITSAPQAMINLFTGKSFGKTLIRLSANQ
jgi:NADPH-dependent curcumin reductase CurA